jgi:hypothetical protein
VDCRCIDAGKRTKCNHAKKFYPKPVRGVPTVFWLFDDALLPPGHSIVPDTPPCKDKCHCNIFSVSEEDMMEICEAIDPKDLFVCRDGDHTKATDVDVANFEQAAKSYELEQPTAT